FILFRTYMEGELILNHPVDADEIRSHEPIVVAAVIIYFIAAARFSFTDYGFDIAANFPVLKFLFQQSLVRGVQTGAFVFFFVTELFEKTYHDRSEFMMGPASGLRIPCLTYSLKIGFIS